MPVDKVRRHVDEDRIHTDHTKEERPLAIALDVDDVIEYPQEYKAPATDPEGEGTGPEVFIDGKHKIPETTQNQEANTHDFEDTCFARHREVGIFQDTSCIDTQQRRADCRYG